MEEEKKREAFSKITELYARAGQAENDIALDELDFSIWIAAFATAGFGLLLIKSDSIIEGTWLTEHPASIIVITIQFSLVGAMLCAGAVRYNVNKRLISQRNEINLLNAQEARVIAGQIKTLSNDITSSVTQVEYLAEDSKIKYNHHYNNTKKLDEKISYWLKAEQELIAFAYIALLFVGLPIKA